MSCLRLKLTFIKFYCLQANTRQRICLWNEIPNGKFLIKCTFILFLFHVLCTDIKLHLALTILCKRRMDSTCSLILKSWNRWKEISEGFGWVEQRQADYYIAIDSILYLIPTKKGKTVLFVYYVFINYSFMERSILAIYSLFYCFILKRLWDEKNCLRGIWLGKLGLLEMDKSSSEGLLSTLV